jgi:hypothetical protein
VAAGQPVKAQDEQVHEHAALAVISLGSIRRQAEGLARTGKRQRDGSSQCLRTSEDISVCQCRNGQAASGRDTVYGSEGFLMTSRMSSVSATSLAWVSRFASLGPARGG